MRQYLVFGIFLYISQHGKVTAKQIAERFEISIRTVYRYLDAISYVGVPVVCEQGRNGGVYILPTFKLQSLNFSDKEKEVIKNALKKEEPESESVKNILQSLDNFNH